MPAPASRYCWLIKGFSSLPPCARALCYRKASRIRVHFRLPCSHRGRGRKPDFERGPGLALRADGDRRADAGVLVDDASHDGEPEAGAMRPCGEEGVEDLELRVRFYSRPLVRHGH